ncbi:hypothetical protein IMZ31_20630 (plasmid) [Pontibacillus sp. ALD_SL1]|uniref:hypothetical protein n=1 Tax=Pontibacillus sp. ALD_SL1 TaxID=2777185 RepID=UPI001A958553|nr:hypothetical protein [Pontibacillus sp. ALD_SL1]QST02956.1 hypothetical protein IMZ31_20630 [Pontibacillus sp. ALD_SL1]
MLRLGIVFFLVFLTACDVPFVPSKQEAIEQYLEESAPLVEASEQLDQGLFEHLSSTEEFVVKADEVKRILAMQQQLYDQLKNTSAPYDMVELKKIYLSLIDERMEQQKHFLPLLYREQQKSVDVLVETYKQQDAQRMTAALEGVNGLVEPYGIERKTLHSEKNDKKE